MRLRHIAPGIVLGSAIALAGPAAAQDVSQTGAAAFDPGRLERIAVAVDRHIEEGMLPGAVTLIARDGEIVHYEAHGELDPQNGTPMPKDAIFRNFSMTKPLVSVAAMMLVEEGRINLNDPITDWMPEFKDMTVLLEDGSTIPANGPIRVYDLLRHTSGFGYSGNTPEAISNAYKEADVESSRTDVSPDEFVARLSEIPLMYQPNTRWHYGLSVDVLGVLLERETGKELHVLLDDMIFTPLGMEDTGFQVPEEDLDRLADALESDPQRVERWQDVRVEKDPSLRYRLGGAGTVTTAHDYYRFAQMMVNGGEFDGTRLLAPKTVELMLSDHISELEGQPNPTTGPGYGFGLGFGVRRADGMSLAPGSPGDAMWAGAGGTSFTIDPAENLVAVFMSAAPSTRFHTRMLFKDLVYGALMEPAGL